MNFNKHLKLEGRHAFLSASKYHWVNYDDDKLDLTFDKYTAAQRGTRLHEFAAESIKLGIKLPRSPKTLNMYINDAIGYKMTTEQPLYYSENCFGTVDAIGFRKNLLRTHDLKTGVTRASFMQLKVYNALFCLEYAISPNDIDMAMRIYQSDEVLEEMAEAEEILYIMNKIIMFDKRIDQLKSGG